MGGAPEAAPLPFPLLPHPRPRAVGAKVTPTPCHMCPAPFLWEFGDDLGRTPHLSYPRLLEALPACSLQDRTSAKKQASSPTPILDRAGEAGGADWRRAGPVGRSGADGSAVGLAALAPAQPFGGGLCWVLGVQRWVAWVCREGRGDGVEQGVPGSPEAAPSEPFVFSLYDQASCSRRCWSRA